MSTAETTRLAHVVATYDPNKHTGKILYVNPSNIRSNEDPVTGLGAGEVALVLRDADGEEIAKVHPQVRYDACAGHGGGDNPGLIQQDIETSPRLASITPKTLAT